MRSIFAKILLWSLGTFALALVAFWAMSRALEPRGPAKGDPFPGLIAMVEDDACRAYEEGGPERLAAHLQRLNSYLPGEHILTDSKGRDLVSGVDRSELLRKGDRPPGMPHIVEGHFIFEGHPRGGRYRFLSIVPPWFKPPSMLPYFGATLLVIALMGSILAVHLAAPLRRLRRVVERFGQGDLSARAGSLRRDEIGELSRAFDDMAGRIEILLAAERRLLQDVSHELRSPLTRLGFAVEWASTGDDRDREAALARVRKEAERMATLIGELLQLTRAEGDPTARNTEDVSLHDLLGDIARDCELEAKARGCPLVLRVVRPAVVPGEAELLRRAVENVVRNAIRHAPEGTSIELGLELRGDVARIVVRDHGPGVPEELLGKIFKPFFRVENDRSRASGGVGLGLAIASRSVGLHQGTITARNASPGLAVLIELPRAHAPAKV